MSLLFQATLNTQKPFINRVVSARERYATNGNSLLVYIKATIKRIFTTTSPVSDTKELIIKVLELINDKSHNLIDLLNKIKKIEWFSSYNNKESRKFRIKESMDFFNNGEECSKL